ncbi:MAG: hypothetical protein JXQ75_22745 [Phycisphaerae bacterium]|nr:hypothetical protein [Phycisphaerae bacterium]
MTADQIRTTVKQHRRAALIGGIAGLVLLFGYIGYNFAMTPPQPDLQTAKAAEVVAYIADERGLAKLPQINQQQFLIRWRDLVMREPQKKEELKECFLSLNDDQRKAFSDAVFKHVKRTFLDDAQQYRQTLKDTRHEFLRKKIAEYHEQAVFMKDVAVGFKKQVSGTQEDMQKWVMEHTSPEERALGEPYVDALKRVREQIKKEERAPEPPAADPEKP